MFRVGERVRIKTLEEIEKTCVIGAFGYMCYEYTENGKKYDITFTESMKKYCGKFAEIVRLSNGTHTPEIDRALLSVDGNSWYWHFVWLEKLNFDNRKVGQNETSLDGA